MKRRNGDGLNSQLCRRQVDGRLLVILILDLDRPRSGVMDVVEKY